MPHQVYDRIELPQIRPDVPRVRLFGGRCACCGARRDRAGAERAGTGLAVRSVDRRPGGVFALRPRHRAPERLCALMGEMFALTISEAAINNMLLRAREPLLVAAAAIRETVTASPVVCSDEDLGTGERQDLVGVGVCRHLGGVARRIRPSRGKAVVQTLFGAVQPMVWVSDMLGSQRGHGIDWQVCLAHLLRDARYAVECGDDRLLRRVQASAAARDCHRATPGHAERYRTG